MCNLWGYARADVSCCIPLYPGVSQRRTGRAMCEGVDTCIVVYPVCILMYFISHPPTSMAAVRPSPPTGPTSTLSTTRHSIRAPTNSMLLSIPVAKHRPTNITRPADMHPLIRLPATTRAPSSTRTTTPTVAADTTSSTTAGPRTNGTGMTLPTRPPQLRFVWDDIDDIFG